jgi:hypothetical protein
MPLIRLPCKRLWPIFNLSPAWFGLVTTTEAVEAAPQSQDRVGFERGSATTFRREAELPPRA